MKYFVIENNGYWEDPYQNRWSAINYTKEEAHAICATLVNCKNCTDCESCINCTDCHYCIGCNDCIDCRYCYDCVNCNHLEAGNTIQQNIS